MERRCSCRAPGQGPLAPGESDGLRLSGWTLVCGVLAALVLVSAGDDGVASLSQAAQDTLEQLKATELDLVRPPVGK